MHYEIVMNCNFPFQLARAAQELTIPYIASGGLADGRGLAAVLALGAAVSVIFNDYDIVISIDDQFREVIWVCTKHVMSQR